MTSGHATMGGVTLTNRDFAEAVGCSPTMASRMRNGQRSPSVSMLRRVVAAYELDLTEAVARADHSAASWGAYLRDAVFSRARTSAPARTDSTAPGACIGCQDASAGLCIDTRVGHAPRCPQYTSPVLGPTALQVEWKENA